MGLIDRLAEAVRAVSGHRVIDVGCGTGSTTLSVGCVMASMVVFLCLPSRGGS